MYLRLKTSSDTYITQDADPEDEWSRDSVGKNWSIEGVELSRADGEHCLAPDFPAAVGDEVYAVYAVYSTGDTFGHEDGAYLEVISFHKSKEIAEKNLAAMSSHAGGQMTIHFDGGGVVGRYCPWDGYFESLDYARCELFIVEAMR